MLVTNFSFVAALVALVVSLVVVGLLNPVAMRLGMMDRPDERKNHAMPTPATGGVAIFIGCLIAFFVFQTDSDTVRAFSGAALLLVLVGIWDDARDLRWYWRILAQAVAALIIIYLGDVRVEQIGAVFGLPELSLGWMSVPFTVFATVGIINAVNMIDGADGQAGLLGLAALVMLMAACVYAGNEALAERVSVLCGALAGFLAWNLRLPWRPRARAVLGNAGSALLGLVIAWVCFRLTQTPGHPVNPVLTLWLLPIPVADCLVVSVRRMREGRSPFAAGHDHIHHIMQDAGFGPTRAALHMTWFSLLSGLLAAQAMRWDVPNLLLLVLFVLLCVGWYALTCKRERAVMFFAKLRVN